MKIKLQNWRHIVYNAVPPLTGAALSLLVILRRLIFTPGYIIYRDIFPGQLYYPYLWHPQGSFLALENYKFVTFTGIFLPLQAFGLQVYEKVVYASAMAIAYVALYVAAFRLLGRVRDGTFSLRTRHLAGGLAALTYIVNPAAANIFFDFSLFVGYAFAPFTLLIFMEMLDGKHRRGLAVVAVAALWWLSAIKAHWIVFGALLLIPPLVIWSVWHRRRSGMRTLRLNLAATAAIIATYLLFGAYWLIPFIQASGQRFVGSYAPMSFESVAYLSNASLHNAVRLLGVFQAWPYVRFEPPSPLVALPWIVASWAIPAMAVAATIWFRRHWQIWVLVVFALAGIFLAKGVAPPLGGLYTFLVFDLTPSSFRWLFRVASKWNVFASLGYSGLVAFALAELMSRVRQAPWRRLLGDKRSAMALLALGGYCVALPLFAWPSFTGDFRGVLVPVSLPDSLLAANQWLTQQEGDFKVNWMPVTNGRELLWNKRPSGALYTSLSPKPSIGTNWNRHPVLYYSYAYDALANDQVADFGKLLSVLNTRFVAYHDDVVTAHVHEGVEPVAVLIEGGEESLTAHLTEQQDMRLAWQDGFISIYETAKFAAPLSVPQRVFLTVDDLSLMTSLGAVDGFHPVENAIAFDASRVADTFPLAVDGLLLGHDASDYLAFAFLPVERFLSSADETHHAAVDEEWSRFDIYQFDWQSVLRERGIHYWGFDYGQGMVAHESSMYPVDQQRETSTYPILKVAAHVPESARYHLWVRHLRHPHAAQLLVSLDGRSHAVLDADHAFVGFVWEDTGVVDLTAGDHIIGLENRDGFTAVNALALVSEDEMATLRARGRQAAAQVPNIYLLEVEEDFDIAGVEAARHTAALSAGRGVVMDAQEPISTTLDLIVPGDYVAAVRAYVPSGVAPLTVTLGTTNLFLEPREADTGLSWLAAAPVHLDGGETSIRVQSADTAVVDAFMLYTTNGATLAPDELFRAADPPAQISYEQINPTRYRVGIRAERPFVLALAETYDPLWTVTGSDLYVSSMPLYGVTNGFFLSRTGSYEVTVEYQTQQWARFGALLTSAAVLVAGLLALLVFRVGREGSPYRRAGRIGRAGM